jgi:hypothetical protein
MNKKQKNLTQMQLYIYPYPNQTKVSKGPAYAFLLTTQFNLSMRKQYP